MNARMAPAEALSRRGFLIAATATGVALGFAGEAAAAAGAPAGFEPTLWYSIGRDGTVTVNIIRAELGQHVGTGVARILADELEADWSKVHINTVDSHPKWGLMVTGGSWSMWQSFPIYSQAGAAGRQVLIEEGAKLLKAKASDCTARNGRVHAGKASIGYGDIVAQGDMAR
ncbi:MAG TPA: molybdopterin cofactor-binding domain-containing protein, partial [Phenylobacterium sp.]